MGSRARIDTELSEQDRLWLDNELIKRGFADYAELADMLRARGYSIGKSLVHRHGQQLERKIEAIRASTRAAKLIAESVDDEADALTGSVISMIQSDTFSVLLALQEAADADPHERLKLLGNAARAAADLSRASIAQKKWSSSVRRRIDEAKANAAAEAESVARRAGMSEGDWSAIRAQILGITIDAG